MERFLNCTYVEQNKIVTNKYIECDLISFIHSANVLTNVCMLGPGMRLEIPQWRWPSSGCVRWLLNTYINKTITDCDELHERITWGMKEWLGKGKFFGRGDFFKILKDENDLAKRGVVRGHSWAEGKGAWCEREEAGEDLRHSSMNRVLEISLWSSPKADAVTVLPSQSCKQGVWWG